MPETISNLSPDGTALWKTQTWMDGQLQPAWSDEERRIAAMPLNDLLTMDSANLDDWQRCLVAKRMVQIRRTAEALCVLAPVGDSGVWHPAVSYLDVFQTLTEAWRQAGAHDRRVEVLKRTLAYAQALDPDNARMCGLDLAEALCDTGRIDQALDIFAEQIRSQPLDPWPYWFMGMSLVRAGSPAWAAAALRRGLEVLHSVGDPESLAGQFEDLLQKAAAAAAGDAPTLPDDFEQLFTASLPHPEDTAPRAPDPRLPTPPRAQPVRREPKPGRNDRCPCGSGKKYKRCCGA